MNSGGGRGAPRSAALLALLLAAAGTAAGGEAYDEGRFEKQVLVGDARDAVQLQVGPEGAVYFIERAGRLRRHAPLERSTATLGTLPAAVHGEGGLVGFALDPGFARNGWIWCLYSPKAAAKTLRLSRFTLAQAGLDLASERTVLAIPFDDAGHFGGGMLFDAAGDLWLGIGDNSTANTTPETDTRPGRETWDALRTSGDTRDLRGKILRIHPRADGGYDIPAGNLFAEAAAGRPEIYAMGCRNPFRLSHDQASGALFWGEVGSNTDERFGTGGYDEINRTRTPGNFGWPLFIGPNTAYRRFDHATGAIGEPYVPERPLNESRNNTGPAQLPPARPALIWYPSEDSREFPELGNGGRAAMAGPLYRFDPALASPIRLPDRFDGQLFIFDWCRNWIKTVSLDGDGAVTGVHPFLPRMAFRRPIDLKLGPDGALYLLEYGERWFGNQDGQLSRLVYQRGNRPPRAVITADALAGPAPLTVALSAASSADPDGDALTYDWSFADDEAGGVRTTWTWREPGTHLASLTVTDPRGLAHTATLRIAVGNAAPRVRIELPRHGGFFDWGEPLAYAIGVDDAEDGASASGAIPASSVRVRWSYDDQPASASGALPEIGHDGAAGAMRRSDCLSCHALAAPSIGPSFLQIAERYRGDPAAPARLAGKVLAGGGGAWGEVPMTPHPQHTQAEVEAMVACILGFQPQSQGLALDGLRGELPIPAKPPAGAGGRYVLSASYADRGAPGVPPLTGEARTVLHARRTRAALFDDSLGASIMEVSTLNRARRICVQLTAGGHLVFRAVDLAGIAQVACDVSASTGHGGRLEFRADSPTGPLVASLDIPVTGQWDAWRTVHAEVRDPSGLHDLYLVAAPLPGGEARRFNLDIVHFVPAKP